MTAPARQGLLPRPGGHAIGWAVFGDPAGAPFYFFHGFPGSRLQAGVVARQATDAGICLVGFDRPGYGVTPWRAAPRVQDTVDDVAALADHLGHDRFAAIGVSCGGPHALAAACRLGPRVRGVGLLAGMAPMDLPALRKGQMPALRALFGLGRVHPWLAAPMFALDRLVLSRPEARALDLLAPMLGPADRAALQADPPAGLAFARGLQEAYRPGMAGAFGDLRRILAWRGLGLTVLDTPVHVFQGTEDRHVPEAMGRHLARRLPAATLHLMPGEGHLSIVLRAFTACVQALGT